MACCVSRGQATKDGICENGMGSGGGAAFLREF